MNPLTRNWGSINKVTKMAWSCAMRPMTSSVRSDMVQVKGVKRIRRRPKKMGWSSEEISGYTPPTPLHIVILLSLFPSLLTFFTFCIVVVYIDFNTVIYLLEITYCELNGYKHIAIYLLVSPINIIFILFPSHFIIFF